MAEWSERKDIATIGELIAYLSQFPPDAYVSVNGQEYHLNDYHEVMEWGEVRAVTLGVDMGLPAACHDAIDEFWRRERANA